MVIAKSLATSLTICAGIMIGGCKQTEQRAAAPVVATVAPPAPRMPSFAREIAPWLAMRCASAESCHGRAPTEKIHLDLRAASAYDQLVNRAAEERAGAIRVKPGDVEGSFLVAKLMGKLRNREGSAMPRDPDTGMPPRTIPEEPDFLDNALKPWILAGAPRN